MKVLFVLLALVFVTQGALAATPSGAIEEQAAKPCPLKAAQNQSPWDMYGTYTGHNSKSVGGGAVTDKSL